jgi:hypothetical protein
MPPEQQQKSRLSHVPAILAGSAAFIAAISTLYVNLRERPLLPPEPVVAEQGAPEKDAAATTAAATPAVPRRFLLRLDRVQVDNDGSMGSTDWSFEVKANGKPLLVVPMPSLSDKPGANLARPEDTDAASAEVDMPPGRNIELSVSGWKKGFISGAKAEVSGKAWMLTGANGTVITLASEKPKGPQFVLYFSARPAE